MKKVVLEAERHWQGQLTGVFHLAGVAESRLVAEETPATLERSLLVAFGLAEPTPIGGSVTPGDGGGPPTGQPTPTPQPPTPLPTLDEPIHRLPELAVVERRLRPWIGS